MKFFIMGDSWGRGEWQINNSNMELIPNTGLDYYLTRLGHIVTNISAGSSCNFGQLQKAYWTLKENNNYDYIIWFHTEPVRDIVEYIIDENIDTLKQYPNFKNIKNYDDALIYINESNYKFAQEKIYNEFNIPFIVIGGVGRLEDSIDNFSFARYKIYSWPEELLNLNYKLPRNFMQWHRSLEIFDHFKYNRNRVLTDLEQVQNYQILLKNSPLFPDDSHVIQGEYEKLANRLLEMI